MTNETTHLAQEPAATEPEEEDYFWKLANADGPGTATPLERHPAMFDTYEEYVDCYPTALCISEERWAKLKADYADEADATKQEKHL